MVFGEMSNGLLSIHGGITWLGGNGCSQRQFFVDSASEGRPDCGLALWDMAAKMA